MIQRITIQHHKPDPKPFVVDHVPPLAADGMNCTRKNGQRLRIVCIDAPGSYPVIAINRAGEPDAFRADGCMGTFEWNIIALDGQPAEPELVRVGSLGVGDIFSHNGLWLILCPKHGWPCSELRAQHLHTGGAMHFLGVELVRQLLPGESLVITVTAEVECGSASEPRTSSDDARHGNF